MWAQGRFPITQVRRTVLLAENRDRVFAAASDFLLQRAEVCPQPLISFRNRRFFDAESNWQFSCLLFVPRVGRSFLCELSPPRKGQKAAVGSRRAFRTAS